MSLCPNFGPSWPCKAIHCGSGCLRNGVGSCPVSELSRRQQDPSLSLYLSSLILFWTKLWHWELWVAGGEAGFELEQMEQHFTVLTDHKNLEHFWSVKQLSPCQARWALFFNQFNVLTFLPLNSTYLALPWVLKLTSLCLACSLVPVISQKPYTFTWCNHCFVATVSSAGRLMSLNEWQSLN